MLYRNTKEILKEILYHPEQYKEFKAIGRLTEKQLSYVVRYRFGSSYMTGRRVAHILMHEDPVELIRFLIYKVNMVILISSNQTMNIGSKMMQHIVNGLTFQMACVQLT